MIAQDGEVVAWCKRCRQGRVVDLRRVFAGRERTPFAALFPKMRCACGERPMGLSVSGAIGSGGMSPKLLELGEPFHPHLHPRPQA